MNTNLIRWTKDDKKELRRVVTNFNAKIRRLEKLGYENLPEKVSYKELIGMGEETKESKRNEIFSRRELNNVMRSLQRFSRRGSEEVVTLEGGEEVTKWEKNEIRIKKARATRSINIQLGSVDTSFGMGNSEIQVLEARLKAIQDITRRKGYEFKRTLDILNINASGDREFRNADQWKTNYLKLLSSFKNFNNYEVLRKKIEEFKNPIEAFEYVEKSNILKDLWVWTDTDAILNPTAQTYAGFKTDQEAFDAGLEQLGLL